MTIIQLACTLTLGVTVTGGCDAELTEHGIYACVSNKGDNTLQFDTADHETIVTYNPITREGVIQFRDIDTERIHILRSIRDDDYHCSITGEA